MYVLYIRYGTQYQYRPPPSTISFSPIWSEVRSRTNDFFIRIIVERRALSRCASHGLRRLPVPTSVRLLEVAVSTDR